MGRGIILPFVDISLHHSSLFHLTPRATIRRTNSQNTANGHTTVSPQPEVLNALSPLTGTATPAKQTSSRFCSPIESLPSPTAKPHRLSATGKRFRLMTRVQPRKPPTSATLRIGHDPSTKPVDRNPTNVTFYLLFRLGKHRHCNHRKRTRISDNPLKPRPKYVFSIRLPAMKPFQAPRDHPKHTFARRAGALNGNSSSRNSLKFLNP